jgi:hypothetical protein
MGSNVTYGPIQAGIVLTKDLSGGQQAYQESKVITEALVKEEEYEELLAKEGYNLQTLIVSTFSLIQLASQTNYMIQNLQELLKGNISFEVMMTLAVDIINVYQSLRFGIASCRILYDYLFGGYKVMNLLVTVGAGRSPRKYGLPPATRW